MKYCLIVEDENIDAFLLQKHLIKMGFLTSVSDNVFHALELIRSGKVDVIATDISMPEVSGMELIKYVRMVNKEIPIVVVTSHVQEEVRIEAYQNGVNFYITKPFNENDIRAAFARYLI